MRDTPLAGSDQRGPKGRGLSANHPRSVGRWVGEAAMVHRGGSRLGGTTAVRSVLNLTATGWHLVQEFIGNRWLLRWKQLLVPRSKRTSASAPARWAYGRPHERQEVAEQGDEDGLLEGMEGRRAMFCRRCIQCNRYRRGPGVPQGELQQAIAG